MLNHLNVPPLGEITIHQALTYSNDSVIINRFTGALVVYSVSFPPFLVFGIVVSALLMVRWKKMVPIKRALFALVVLISLLQLVSIIGGIMYSVCLLATNDKYCMDPFAMIQYVCGNATIILCAYCFMVITRILYKVYFDKSQWWMRGRRREEEIISPSVQQQQQQHIDGGGAPNQGAQLLIATNNNNNPLVNHGSGGGGGGSGGSGNDEKEGGQEKTLQTTTTTTPTTTTTTLTTTTTTTNWVSVETAKRNQRFGSFVKYSAFTCAIVLGIVAPLHLITIAITSLTSLMPGVSQEKAKSIGFTRYYVDSAFALSYWGLIFFFGILNIIIGVSLTKKFVGPDKKIPLHRRKACRQLILLNVLQLIFGGVTGSLVIMAILTLVQYEFYIAGITLQRISIFCFAIALTFIYGPLDDLDLNKTGATIKNVVSNKLIPANHVNSSSTSGGTSGGGGGAVGGHHSSKRGGGGGSSSSSQLPHSSSSSSTSSNKKKFTSVKLDSIPNTNNNNNNNNYICSVELQSPITDSSSTPTTTSVSMPLMKEQQERSSSCSPASTTSSSNSDHSHQPPMMTTNEMCSKSGGSDGGGAVNRV